MIVLVTGGARSGKSTFAEKYAAKLGAAGTYIATAQALDEEMEQRVEGHRRRREQDSLVWKTLEEPYHLSTQLAALQKQDEAGAEGDILLVDCLTLWLSNWLLHYEQDDPYRQVSAKLDELVQVLSEYKGSRTIILVTNEVGGGIVPDYPLGRQFRDLSGMMNQRVAAVSDQVFLITAGIAVELKELQYRL